MSGCTDRRLCASGCPALSGFYGRRSIRTSRPTAARPSRRVVRQKEGRMTTALIPTVWEEIARIPTEEPWRLLQQLVLDAVSSPNTKRSYAVALQSFFAWRLSTGSPGFTRAAVQQYRAYLEAEGRAPSSINVYLSALRKLAQEAREGGWLNEETTSSILRVKGVKQGGRRTGNWLTPQQASDLLQAPDAMTLKGLRDRAILGLLLGCGLRRAELARLAVEHVQMRDARWVLVDLLGKGKRLRTVPVPAWTKVLLDAWTEAARVELGPLFRAVNKGGRLWGETITDDVIWAITREYGSRIGQSKLAPHDLRRTCAKLCRSSGGALEQIQLLLGHASIQTTERYLGTEQNLAQAVNDHLPIEVNRVGTIERNGPTRVESRSQTAGASRYNAKAVLPREEVSHGPI